MNIAAIKSIQLPRYRTVAQVHLEKCLAHEEKKPLMSLPVVHVQV